MKLSTRARYALRFMVTVAKRADDDCAVSIAEVARATGISRRYLEQLVVPLRRSSLIRGVSGRRGGYVLVESPGRISIRRIVEAAIGPINIVDCVCRPATCIKSDACECRDVYRALNEGIVNMLNGLALADLVRGAPPEETGPDGARGRHLD